jgi:hypothetical protein
MVSSEPTSHSPSDIKKEKAKRTGQEKPACQKKKKRGGK